MEEKKTKKTRRSPKKKTVKQPGKSLYETISTPLEEPVLNTDEPIILNRVVMENPHTINIKMMVPRLPDEPNTPEGNEKYSKRFPKYAHPGDLGMDVTAIGVEYDEDYDRYMYHTGVYCETVEGDGCFLMPRSSNSKTDAQLGNGIGLVETVNYRGELIFAFKNRTSLWNEAFQRAIWKWVMLPWYKRLFTDFSKMLDAEYVFCKENALEWAPYKVGDRIGQIVWNKFPKNINIEIVDELSKTERGDGGFGSTGK